MGTAASQLDTWRLLEYEELTFLTKQEILLAYKKFDKLIPKKEKNRIDYRISMNDALTLPELKSNPLNKRICKVFSTSDKKDGSLSFDDFLDLLSAFSESATLDIKTHYAFRIFDFDDDEKLGRLDLKKLVDCLTSGTNDSKLTPEESSQLVTNILEEADIDGDGSLNFFEFKLVISRSPDFASSFKIVL